MVTLYSDVNYQGSSSFEFTGPGHTPDFYYGALSSMDKVASSMEIKSKQPKSGCIRVFTDYDFLGISSEICFVIGDLVSYSWDNQIRSFIIGSGCNWTFYADPYWRGAYAYAEAGRRESFTYDTWVFGDGISSLKRVCPDN